MESHHYHVHVTWSNDRKGLMHSPEIKAAAPESEYIAVATPPQFPKGMEGLWSPEHLFTAAVSSCFMTTFLAIAENSKLDFKSFSCNSSGKLEKVDGKLLMTEVSLEPTLVIADEEDHDKALRVLVKSESACLISNSINAKVVLKPTVQSVLCKA